MPTALYQLKLVIKAFDKRKMRRENFCFYKFSFVQNIYMYLSIYWYLYDEDFFLCVFE
jgi:hypothetical protein